MTEMTLARATLHVWPKLTMDEKLNWLINSYTRIIHARIDQRFESARVLRLWNECGILLNNTYELTRNEYPSGIPE